MGSRWEGEADRKQKSLRIGLVNPIARRSALLLGQQHGSEAEPPFVAFADLGTSGGGYRPERSRHRRDGPRPGPAVPRDHHKGLLRLKIGPGLMAASAQPWTEAAFHLDRPQGSVDRGQGDRGQGGAERCYPCRSQAAASQAW
jgi:hypothetical protein